jgi:hypothetical protein
MFDDIPKVDSVLRPDIVNAARDRNHNQEKKDQSPPAKPENTEEQESEEAKTPPHLLDVRI